MKTLKTILVVACIYFTITTGHAQDDTTLTVPKKNSSQETITKITRVKGANGEEKIITQEQIITKESQLKLNPEDQDKTNQTATYTPQEIFVKNLDSISDERTYSMKPDGIGYIFKFNDEIGQKISKARPLSNNYYLVNNGDKDNCLGHFDKNKNFILEFFDPTTDGVTTLTYKISLAK